ncbi:SGNH/GDSL hydrolase family protein [Serratia marcescens]|uniref:SGNH/GDSL hydrolase family protein n=1 Tax=Serratia marcescens TaxID=615 RepID=UPI00115B689C|nr:SGNH/GDSL hydrolase family protein [Serratia marcescens]
MTTYNTGNELGSVDPRDLYDNAENLDKLLLGEQHNYPDRLNKLRVSWSGFEYYIKNSGAAMAFATEQELLAFTPATDNVLAQVTSTGVFYYWNGTVWSKSAYQPTLDILHPYRLGLFISGKNKYNYKTSLDGKYINEEGVISDNDIYSLSDYIPVSKGVRYLSNYNIRFASFFDKDQAYIGFESAVLSFIVPEDAAFVRVTTPLETKHLMQLEVGGSRTVYESYVDNFRKENIDFAKVSLRAVMGYEKGKNLFNPLLAMQGYFINASGVLSQSATNCTSDYIPVIGGTDYKANQNLRSVVYYDESKNRIDGALDITGFFTVPVNCYYIRCSVFLSRMNDTQIERGKYITEFYSFGVEPPASIDAMPIKYPVQNINPDNIGIFTHGKNILNPYTLVSGFIDEWGFYNPDGTTYLLSDYIEIKPSSSYASNKSMRFISFYDENKAFISTAVSSLSFTAPANSKYVRVTVSLTNLPGFQLEKGTLSTDYEEFHYEMKSKLDNGTPVIISPSTDNEIPEYFGLERLRETHMRLSKLTYNESVQFSWAMIGDSYTRGQMRYALKCAQKLWHLYNGTSVAPTVPPIGFGYRSFGYDANGDNTDIIGTPITQTGFTCAYNTGNGLDISSVTSSTAGSTLTWSDNFALGFAYTLYAEGGSGVISYNAPGMTAAVEIDLSTYPTGMQMIPMSSIPTSGSGTVTISLVSGTAVLYGINVMNATQPGVVVHKLGGSGSYSTQWVNANETRWKTAFTTLKANLVTIMLGTNDQGVKLAPATFKSNILTMINRVRAATPTADILLICPAENNRPGGNTIAMSNYSRQMYEISREQDVAFMNLQSSFGVNPADYAYGSARPWMVADGLHPDPSTGGHAIASAIMRALKAPL